MIRQYLLASGVLGLVLLAPSAGQGHEDGTASTPDIRIGEEVRLDRWRFRIVTDEDTGCQYLWITSRPIGYAGYGGMSPRLDEDGEPMGCHREDE